MAINNEQWLQWKPVEELADKYYIDAVLDTMSGFKVELSELGEREKKVFVIWENSVDAYRSTNESFRQEIISELGKKHSSSFYGDWTFFKVENSRYVQWLSDQSYGFLRGSDFIHFSFIAADSILDVVTTYEPTVEIVNEL